jgi:hypothetical protein
MVEKYSGGEHEMIKKLHHFFTSSETWPKQYADMQKVTQLFFEESIQYYIEHRPDNTF